MKILLGLIILLPLVSCVPSGRVQTAGVAGDDNTTPTPTSTSDVELVWYQGTTSDTRLTLYRDDRDNVYLRGRRIEDFLLAQNSPSTNYCLEMDMGSTVPLADRRYMRLRAVPKNINNVFTGVKTVYLQVDFSNPTAGQSVCSLDKLQYVTDSTTQLITFASVTAKTTFNLSTFFQSASSVVSTTNMKLYQVEPANGRMVEIRQNALDLTPLKFTLQPGSGSGTSTSCTDGSCRAQGYQCCIENQCVNDANVRTGVDTMSLAFLTAEQERISNTLAFLNYPQFYYICGTNQPPTGSSGGSQSTADAAAAARLLEMKNDYYCQELLKSKSTATPFHQAPYNASATYDQSICNTTTASAQLYYQSVLSRIYVSCGCDSAIYPTLSDKVANCPAYVYRPAGLDSSGAPTRFDCGIETGSTTGSVSTGGTVSVSGKTAPHRYFNTAGVEVNPASPPANTLAEGTTFSYANPEKTMPINGTTNMNSILGQFNVELTDAKPAKGVAVELDRVYLISTRSGAYTFCPSCAEDSWYQGFKPKPSAFGGSGVQASGFSTMRDDYDGNLSAGNYEDTIFGRACWVPPTMLPFSQPVGMATSEAQRQLRLKTQATMWVNGYQRDWYGFNQGALIGSFDGVSWFAIGKGRIIRSTSKKLFLAINAPFADLANDSAHVVSVQEFVPGSNGAQLDFHPEYTQNHQNQNSAGTCQAYHRCNVDSDCITRLGWEYVCADVTQLKTHWPTFAPETASEDVTPSSATPRNIEGILAQAQLPSGSSKRCVYRGAGAPCRTDSGSITAADMEKRKLLTCAPNFWCADVDSTNANIPSTSTTLGVFNREVARFAASLDEVPVSRNHLFGQDANQIGRPLDYVHTKTGSTNLSSISDANVKSTLEKNIGDMDTGSIGKVGLCRPGKRLPSSTDISSTWSPFAQHQSLDEFARTDFISQIGSCPSNYLSKNKTASCPVFNSEGNYLHQTDSFATTTQSQWVEAASRQNSCGLESLKTGSVITGVTADQMQLNSPFRAVEAKPLNAGVVLESTLARDACLRRAGSVCHTDLDCSPNAYHASEIANFTDSYFGSSANREYYEQYLVCGQETPKPGPNDAEYDTFDMTKNRCCRPVGEDITTHSAQAPSSTSADAADSANLDPLITGASAPTDASRYERFSHVVNHGTTAFPPLNGYDGRDGSGNLLTRMYGSTMSANITTSKQWATLNEANGKTCCGGGWVRKFNDGTNDWSAPNRLAINVSQFRCLNYLSPLVGASNPAIFDPTLTQTKIDQDWGRYCTDINGVNGNCAQITIPQGSISDLTCASSEYEPASSNPYSVAAQAQLSTLPGEVAWTSGTNIFAFFPPTSADSDPANMMDFATASNRKNITINLPSYMGAGLSSIVMQRRSTSNALTEVTCWNGPNGGGGSLGISDSSSTGTCNMANGCCYEYNSTTRILKVALNQTASGTPFYNFATPTSSGRYGVKLTFLPPGIGNASLPLAKRACSDVHYLNILGKMELAGIPQITYPKILCNNNAEKLVPGLFRITDTDTNRAQFNTSSNAFRTGGQWRTNYHGLENEAVFSPHEFKCCTPLNKKTKNAETCCSGYGVEVPGDGSAGSLRYQCKLPPATNLNVYFNRFVSNEGMSADLNAPPLSLGDFDDQSGEPLISTTVLSKIRAIGQQVCGSGQTRRGGAFGSFQAEPASAGSGGTTVYGIVDSTSDIGQNSSGGGTDVVGYNTFMQGYRWNHHIYCK